MILWGALISMALVADDGGEFYEVLECENPSDWVNFNVMPHLGKKPVTLNDFRTKLKKFLQRYNELTIIADWPDDFRHFCDVIVHKPGDMLLKHRLIRMVINRDLDSKKSSVPHNALFDAIAIRDAFFHGPTRRSE